MMLDPDDPMGAIFCIDYFALRSQNYRWLQVSPVTLGHHISHTSYLPAHAICPPQ